MNVGQLKGFRTYTEKETRKLIKDQLERYIMNAGEEEDSQSLKSNSSKYSTRVLKKAAAVAIAKAPL